MFFVPTERQLMDSFDGTMVSLWIESDQKPSTGGCSVPRERHGIALALLSRPPFRSRS